MAHTQKTEICTCMILSFEADGIRIWFNKTDLRFVASSKKLLIFPCNSKDCCDSIFSVAALDLPCLRITPPTWRTAEAGMLKHFQRECNVKTTFKILLTCSLPFHSCSFVSTVVFPAAMWPIAAMPLQTQRTSRQHSFLPGICKRYNNVSLLSKLIRFRKCNCVSFKKILFRLTLLHVYYFLLLFLNALMSIF